MKQISSLKEFYEVIEQNKHVMIYWYTKWCPDCFAIKPHLPRLEEEYSTLQWYGMDRDIDIHLAKHLEIYGIPSFILFKNGEEQARYVDKRRKSYQEVKQFIDSNLG
jgi:thiol-disulfide isomerase/thioredoxin